MRKWNMNEKRARLLISCVDRPGIVAAVSRFLLEHGANIVQSDQYTTDPVRGMFFMRIVFDLEDVDRSLQLIEEQFAQVAEQFDMNWHISAEKKIKRMAIFVSKEDHCLMELLWRWKAGELPVEISMVISNYEDSREAVEAYGIPYFCVPVTPNTKKDAEQKALYLMRDKVDFIVLARYMQILSSDFVSEYHHRIINIHHSFLPAFIGANPYKRAFERGVKLIGATAHYVTNDLDEGPIIEQDVLRVNHRYTVEELKVVGRQAERIALAKAVSWHIQDKVLVHENKTVVFD
ncbi:formyltetrahydrofolate deformylase [Ammoniphilus sp. CFH 90114]|uniref:formyltetrahydrofolate deformylase n=1 Tax=Ammoniphilus sp. CFH 90114 TaxID=2493665 RepID=UPI00100E3221|nr:formyltetrahydrofolate deformylase [Ammoniphilus sp. CFH 90114]RXT04148.1 formyltetrahydrofolate deformylase [Ammoniphilus sp. CFH 90114]